MTLGRVVWTPCSAESRTGRLRGEGKGRTGMWKASGTGLQWKLCAQAEVGLRSVGNRQAPSYRACAHPGG